VVLTRCVLLYCLLQTLIDAGVEQKKITFLNVISCPEGLAALFNAYPGKGQLAVEVTLRSCC
jgi:uracil phosphoribosyltransferase